MLASSGRLLSGHSPRLFDRELSWIAFNRRLLYEVAHSGEPILDRLLKLSQTCTALDEYFMVRVPLLKGDRAQPARSLPEPRFQQLHACVRSLLARQQAHFAFNLKPGLKDQGIHLLNYGELTDIQRRQLYRRFEDEVAPVLHPLITPPSAAIPDFSNLSLNLAVCLADQATSQLAWVKVPRILSRFMVLPGLSRDRDWLAIPIEQVIAAHLLTFFPAFQIQGSYPFRVTRSADLGVLDSETANLMEMIQESLQKRQQQGQAVRLEITQSLPETVKTGLTNHLGLSAVDTYSVSGWLGLSDLYELTRLPRSDLAAPTWYPVLPEALCPQPKPAMLSFVATPKTETDFFSFLRQRDLLLHFPYHSFTATVEQFVEQAALDPAVLTIKITLYRTAGDAPIVRSLIAAAKAGKQIVVLVELTAPLDEAINIHWARSLEKAGAHVVYGVVGLKTHTNLVLIVRRENQEICQYAYIGTGDYLPNRPQPYEDLGLLTSRQAVTVDLSHLFNFLTGCSRQVGYQTLMVAPDQLRTQLTELIERETRQAQAGKPGRLIAKLNLLADPDLIEVLYAASQAGVEVDLIVRGICCLRPGVPGLSDRIRVVSILGQCIEHSRILYCHNGGQSEAWLGTADWTPRGLGERIEVMVPIYAPDLVADLQRRLEQWLRDNQSAWILQSDGRYVPRRPAPEEPLRSAQQQFMEQARKYGKRVAL